MKLRIYAAAALILTLMSACGDTTFEEKNINGEFTIEIPNYMVELDLGIPEASLEYGNEMREHYVTVLRESPEVLASYGVTNIEDYATQYVTGVEMSITDPVSNRISEGIEQQNGMQSITYEITGIMEPEDLGIYYYVQFYKSKAAYYYVLVWTLDSYEDKYKGDMEKITKSLKEL